MSIPSSVDAATRKILDDAAKVRAVSKNLADVAATTQGQVQAASGEIFKSIDDIRALVDFQVAHGFHTPLGQTIDPNTGLPMDPFSPFQIEKAGAAPTNFDSLGFDPSGTFQKGDASEQAGNVNKPPLSYNDDPNGYKAPTQQYGQTGTPVAPPPAAPTPPPDQFGSQQDFPIDNTGSSGGDGGDGGGGW